MHRVKGHSIKYPICSLHVYHSNSLWISEYFLTMQVDKRYCNSISFSPQILEKAELGSGFIPGRGILLYNIAVLLCQWVLAEDIFLSDMLLFPQIVVKFHAWKLLSSTKMSIPVGSFCLAHTQPLSTTEGCPSVWDWWCDSIQPHHNRWFYTTGKSYLLLSCFIKFAHSDAEW